MIVAVMPSTGVRGRCPRGAAGRSRPRRPPPPSACGTRALVTVRVGAEVDVGHPERRGQRLRRLPARRPARSRSPRSGTRRRPREASMTTAPATRLRPALVATSDRRRRARRGPRQSWTKAWSRTRTPGLADERLPDDLEVVRVVRDAGARRRRCWAARRPGRAVAVPPRRRRRSPPTTLTRVRARRVEAVERVEHGRARAAEERELLDEQDRRAGARGGDRRASSRPSRTRRPRRPTGDRRTAARPADRPAPLAPSPPRQLGRPRSRRRP